MPFDLVQYVLVLTDGSNISLVKSVNIQHYVATLKNWKRPAAASALSGMTCRDSGSNTKVHFYIKCLFSPQRTYIKNEKKLLGQNSNSQ